MDSDHSNAAYHLFGSDWTTAQRPTAASTTFLAATIGICLPITGLAGDMNAIREVLSDEQWEQLQAPAVIELKAGQCSFHHPLLIHGSFENNTNQPRRAVVLNAFRDGVTSDTNEPLLEGAPIIEKGQAVAGQLFPRLT